MASAGRPLRAGVRWARPLATAVVRAQLDARHGGQLVVTGAGAGDTTPVARLASELGAQTGTAGPRDLLIGVAWPWADNATLGTAVGDHRRAGGEALIVVVGNAVERRALERELRTDPDVGISVMLFVDALSGDELLRVRRRVADLLVVRGDGMRREYDRLHADIARQLEHRLAQRLAVRSALVANPDKMASTLKSQHAKLAADTTSLSDTGFDAKHIGLVAAVALVAPIWRRAAVRLTAFLPFTRIVVRGGLVYTITRLVGMGAQRLAMHGRAPHQEER
jgi:hypothetical protein